eukprot:462469_1
MAKAKKPSNSTIGLILLIIACILNIVALIIAFGCWPWWVLLIVAIVLIIFIFMTQFIGQCSRYGNDRLFAGIACGCTIVALCFAVMGMWLCGDWRFVFTGAAMWLVLASAILQLICIFIL